MQRTNRKAYKLIVEKVVVNLFSAWKNNKRKVVGFSRRSNFYDAKNPMDNRFYNNPALGYDRVTKVLDILEQNKY